MSDSEAALGIVLAAFYGLGIIAALVSPTFRVKLGAALIGFARAARRMYVEVPLRLLTGRRRPNYVRSELP